MSVAKNTLRTIEEWPDLGIVLPDGCRLSARVWLPKDASADPVPVILEYLPYRKRDGTTARDALTHPWLAKRGYACVRVDMRGNGDSEGLMQDEYSPQELADAVDVITWLASQPWSTGNVGMMGISWGGFNSLQVAALQPEPLKAIISLCATTDRYHDDIHYKGGCLLNENFGWSSQMWAYSSRPPDPALRPNWRELWLERLENEPFLISTWLRHQRRDSYWRHGSVCEDYAAIKAKVLTIGGWGDGYKNTAPTLVQNVPGAKGITGPWIHKYPHFAIPEPRIGFLQEALRWWDRWLKGEQNNAEDDPAYRHYLIEGAPPQRSYSHRPGIWLADDAIGWPMQRLPLSDLGLAQGSEAFERRVASPQHCGLEGGEYFAFSPGPEMPGDQRADDALSACFDTLPVDEDVDVTGAPVVSLTLVPEGSQAQISVRLNHVLPDGASTRISFGLLNLTHHKSHAAPSALELGKPITVEVKLDHCAYRVPKGHKLRIAISNTYWPLVWPMPEPVPVMLQKGHVDLPVRPTSEGAEWVFPEPVSEAPWDVDVLREERQSQVVETDMGSGRVTVRIERDNGKRRDRQHGLISGSVSREWWGIHPNDSLSATAKTHWTEEIERGGIHLRTETYSEMWSDAAAFYVTGKVTAFANEELIYERSVKDSISRDFL
ncbi:CocE/NonD family hydrolase [Shimia sediminis]|uniref:CocE/NonD family hydrolase n=1 Tax=Shimia sediminis TaxID=2497945 RepID=UPI000F8F17E3|nr:CocE/NonD family hydrolase [Shimia sediminis]